MNRFITNSIRFFMDECLPPLIRDNYYFMYPFFFIWFKGKNIKQIMDFKSRVYSMSKKEFSEFYEQRKSLATDRETDLSEKSINYMLKNISNDSGSIIDIGCGNGYFINKVNESVNIECHGCDIVNSIKYDNITFHNGDIENLPFEDNLFDIVTCHHTLEHVINVNKAVSELKRIAKKQVIIVVPCQRYFYYTLDEHIRFFPYKELVEDMMRIDNNSIKKVWSDWVYIGNL